MKNFFLVLNDSKKGVVEYADKIEKIIKEKGANSARTIGYLDKENMPSEIDCIISLGGDGTIMRVARDIATSKIQIPILGINMGNLGYLTSLSTKDSIEKLIDDLLLGKYSIEKRTALYGYAIKNGIATKKYIAINELVVTRILSGKPIQCKVTVNDEYFNTYNSDGIIISTPTGSTAYNLSAGGPLVEPTAKVFVITPICPHTLNLRSIILSSESLIEIEIIGLRNFEQAAVFDGDDSISLSAGDKVIIRESKSKIHFVKLNDTSFMENLRNKMRGM